MTSTQNLSALSKRWIIREPDARHVSQICQTHSLPEIVARLLVNRGILCDQVDAFLNPTIRDYLPDPSNFKDMDKAVARVTKAILDGEKIAVFGDYDVDGATSAALLARYFRQVGVLPVVYIPDRQREGYGPSVEGFKALHSQGVRLILTVDCGVSAHDQIDFANEAGTDVIVLDHHAADIHLPKAVAVINPNRVDEDNTFGNLAACGVTFLFLIALNRHLRTSGFFKENKFTEPDLLSLLDIVALGTVCDVVSLTALNRAFVTQGLKILSAFKNPGLRALAAVSSISERVTPYHLGFLLGPRINAGGRVGCSDYGWRLLATEDPVEIQKLAYELDKFNLDRREIEKQVLIEADEQAALQQNDKFILVSAQGWHSGVIGIVAGRLKEKYHRPVAVISFDENGDIGTASARSITGCDLGASIHAAVQAGILESGGGHPMAGGFKISREKLPAFKDFLEERFSALDTTPRFHIEGVVSLKAVSKDLIEKMNMVGPFGAGNPTPKLLIKDVFVKFAKPVGTDHIKCELIDYAGNSLSAIAFRAVDSDLNPYLSGQYKSLLDVAGTLSLNVWAGQEKVQLTIEDIRESNQEI